MIMEYEVAKQLKEAGYHADELGKLATAFRRMPELFEATLGYPQLTRRSSEG
jgi:hypothetical protein